MKINPKLYHIGLAVYCAAIFILSSIPGDNFPEVDFKFSDKFVHLIIYAVLFCLFFYSLKNQSKYVRLQTFALEYSLLFTALYGITDELHQYFVVNRSCEFYDWLADVAGALIMYLIFKYLNKKRSLIAILFLFVAAGCAGSGNSNSNSAAVTVESAESWLNLMPGFDQNNTNLLGFNIKLKLTGNLTDTNFSVSNFKIFLNNDTLSSKRFIKQSHDLKDNSFSMDISQVPNEIYLDKVKELPERAVFSFNIMRNNKLIKSVKTQSIAILKTY